MSDKSKRSKIANFVACCQEAEAEGIQIFRPALGEVRPYEVKTFAGPPREDLDWVHLDAQTASMVCMVYDTLTGEKHEYLFQFPPPKAVRVDWKIFNAIEGKSWYRKENEYYEPTGKNVGRCDRYERADDGTGGANQGDHHCVPDP